MALFSAIRSIYIEAEQSTPSLNICGWSVDYYAKSTSNNRFTVCYNQCASTCVDAHILHKARYEIIWLPLRPAYCWMILTWVTQVYKCVYAHAWVLCGLVFNWVTHLNSTTFSTQSTYIFTKRKCTARTHTRGWLSVELNKCSDFTSQHKQKKRPTTKHHVTLYVFHKCNQLLANNNYRTSQHLKHKPSRLAGGVGV